MMRLHLDIEPDNTFYDLHSKGLEVDDGAEFYTALVLGLFPQAREIKVKTVPHENPPELGDLIHEVDGLWESLTVRPDWGSDELEWIAPHVETLRNLLYRTVRVSCTIPEGEVMLPSRYRSNIAIVSISLPQTKTKI